MESGNSSWVANLPLPRDYEGFDCTCTVSSLSNLSCEFRASTSRDSLSSYNLWAIPYPYGHKIIHNILAFPIEPAHRTCPSKPAHRTCPSNLSFEPAHRTCPSNLSFEPAHRTCPSNLSFEPAHRTCPSNLPIEPAHRTCPSNLPIEPPIEPARMPSRYCLVLVDHCCDIMFSWPLN